MSASTTLSEPGTGREIKTPADSGSAAGKDNPDGPLGGASQFVQGLRHTLERDLTRVQEELVRELAGIQGWVQEQTRDSRQRIAKVFDQILAQLSAAANANLESMAVTVNMLKQQARVESEGLEQRGTEAADLLFTLKRISMDLSAGVVPRLAGKGAMLRETTAALQEQMQAMRHQVTAKFELQQEYEELELQRSVIAERIAAKKKELALSEDRCKDAEARHQQIDKDLAVAEHLIKEKRERLELLEKTAQGKQDLMKSLDDLIKTRCEGQGVDGVPASSGKVTTLSKQQVQRMEAQQQLSMMQSQIIHFYDAKTCCMFVYHIPAHRLFSIDSPELRLYVNHDSVQIGDRVFVHGGLDTISIAYGKQLTRLELMDKSRLEVTPLAEAAVPRSQHKLVAFDSCTIFALAGRNKEEKFLNSCERYSVTENRWAPAPPLNERKVLVSAVALYGEAVYVFGGFNGSLLNTIEMLRPGTGGKWSVIKIKGGTWKAKHEMGCFQRGADEIVVFGGIDNSRGGSDETFVFSQKAGTMQLEKGRLKVKDWFQMRTPVQHGSEILVVGQFARDLHVYCLEKADWTLVPRKSLETAEK